MDIQGRNTAFCPYCGTQFYIDTGEKIVTKNININKNIKKDINQNFTNAADLAREQAIDRENERKHKEFKWIFILPIALLCLFFVMSNADTWKEQKAIEAGLIQVGQSSENMKGKNYNEVEAQLRSAGFTNISFINLDDAGWLKNKKNTVASVAIGGETNFQADDYYDPNIKIVITFH